MKNPLIDETFPSQTLTNVSGVLAFLQGSQPLDGCTYSAEDSYYFGQYLIFNCMREALEYEKDRVETMRTEGKS